MNAFLLLLPVILIRYLLLGLFNRESLKRAAFFPERLGFEKAAYWLYQLSTALLFLYPIFLRVAADQPFFHIGLSVYSTGLAACAVSMHNFARSGNGLTTKGLYRLSRNPMYIGYFLCFFGVVLITRSPVLLAALIVFQASAHWIIRSEERWCVRVFGDEYVSYMKKVRRYF